MSLAADHDNVLLSEAWRLARPRLLARVAELNDLLLEPDSSRDELRRRAHRLSGTLGCFGLHDCGFLARVLENRLVGKEDLREMVGSVATLYQQIQKADPAPTRARGPMAPVALFAGPSFPVADLLAFGYSLGVKIVPMHDLGGLVGKSWSLIILDASHASFETFPKDLDIPILGVIETDTLENRLRSVAAGAQLVCCKQDDIKLLFTALTQLFDSANSVLRRILMVDDDPVFSLIAKRVLTSAGYQVAAETDAESFWRRLETFVPDLLLLDLALPGISGEDLCRVIRADARWSDLPIIFLTASDEDMVALRLHEVGADDRLTKPVEEGLLLRCIANHGRRRQAHRKEMLDGLTKLPTRKLATENLERMMSLCRRQATAMSLAILDLDHFKSINDIHGHIQGDRVLTAIGELLKGTFRNEDVVSRWGGEEFLVAQLGCNGKQALERLEQVLEQFQKRSFISEAGSFQVSFSAGIAVFPDGGTDIGTLYRQADAALYRAKEAGRARVFLAQSLPHEIEDEPRTHVMLVEDDLELSKVILSACSFRGFVAVHYTDGLRALEDWLEEKVGWPRILLVDNDLPGMSGVDLLSRLVDEGRLEDTKVLMLSGLPEFSEILESGNLGEYEYISKPFVLGSLMEKLEAILYTPIPRPGLERATEGKELHKPEATQS